MCVSDLSMIERPLRIGDVVLFGKFYWRVLAAFDDKALIISEAVIMYRSFNEDPKNNSWEASSLRMFLNGAFLSGFNYKERERIVNSRISNKGNLWYDIKGGDDTYDRIFLLSIEEADIYFGNSGDYERDYPNRRWDGMHKVYFHNFEYFSNLYDKDREARFAGKGCNCSWILRSPGSLPTLVPYVTDRGSVYVSGGFVRSDTSGIRPSLWLSL